VYCALHRIGDGPEYEKPLTVTEELVPPPLDVVGVDVVAGVVEPEPVEPLVVGVVSVEAGALDGAVAVVSVVEVVDVPDGCAFLWPLLHAARHTSVATTAIRRTAGS
jgi:hypothetical protein